MMRETLLIMALAGVLAGQTAATTASVSGLVMDKASGKPLANYAVSTMLNVRWVGNTVVQSANTKDVSSTTDSSGRYKLAGLPTGTYRITARPQRAMSGASREVVVNGSDVEHIDFRINVPGVISGKVVDENREPVPNVWVRLITREYFLGSAGYHLGFGMVATNDRGEYTLTGVDSGAPYFLMMEHVERNLPAKSEAPANPKLRRRVPIRTWYPNSPSVDGAQPVMLQSGEKREGVDIEIRKSPSFCVAGHTMGAMGAAAVRFSIEQMQPSSGISGGGGTFVAAPGGTTGTDGEFRICDLFPGTFRLEVSDKDYDRQPVPGYGSMEVTVSDRDIDGLVVAALPGKPVEGEVVWEGQPPATAPDGKLSVSLSPMFRAPFMNESSSVRADIPGGFTMPAVLPDEYEVRTGIFASGVYVKDVTFGGRSVLYAPVRVGAAMGGTALRVILAHDGATISVQVADKDGNPGAGLGVLLIPADVASEGVLAARLVKGQTNQFGQYTSQTVPPGKYYVVATDEPVDSTPERIGRLWRVRNRFKEVDAPPSGSAQVQLEPGKIE